MSGELSILTAEQAEALLFAPRACSKPNLLKAIKDSGCNAKWILDAIKCVGDSTLRSQLMRITHFPHPPQHWYSLAQSIIALRIGVNQLVSPLTNADIETEQISRSRPVVAAILQEYLAYGLISPDDIKNMFDLETYNLTKKMADITRMPFTLRLPDNEGKWRLTDYFANQKRLHLCRSIFEKLVEDPQIAELKTVILYTQMRSIQFYAAQLCITAFRHNPHTGNLKGLSPRFVESYRHKMLTMALTCQVVYLNIARKNHWKKLVDELQKIYLEILDPTGKREIEKYILSLTGADKPTSPLAMRNLQKTIHRHALEQFGQQATLVTLARTKHPASIAIKGFQKELNSILKRMQEIKSRVVILTTRIEDSKWSSDRKERTFNRILKFEKDQLDLLCTPSILFKEDRIEVCKDILGFKVIVKLDGKTKEEIARCLNELHASLEGEHGGLTFNPIDKRFKDYVSTPKENGYQALHDSYLVTDQNGNKQIIEIQFVTQEMEHQNTYGKAQHAGYKAGVEGTNPSTPIMVVSVAEMPASQCVNLFEHDDIAWRQLEVDGIHTTRNQGLNLLDLCTVLGRNGYNLKSYQAVWVNGMRVPLEKGSVSQEFECEPVSRLAVIVLETGPMCRFIPFYPPSRIATTNG